MRAMSFVSLLSTLFLSSYQLTTAAPTKKIADLSCYQLSNGNLDVANLQADYQFDRLKTDCRHPLSTDAGVASSVRPFVQSIGRPQKALIAKKKSGDLSSEDSGTGPSVKFLLRKDFSDVGLFSAITSTSKAEGASISWTQDNVARDRIWAVDGLAALAFSYMTDDYDSPFIGVTIAPYVKVQKEFHSKVKATDTDANTYGGSAEIGFQNFFGLKGADYFRAKWSLTDDNVEGTQIGQATGEWIPTYLRLHREFKETRLNVHFRPQFVAQYDYVSEGVLPLLFSGQRESLRVGPEATLLFNFLTAGMENTSLAAILASVHGRVTYHWWTETYSNRTGSWLEASLNYNLDPAGFVGLSANYRKGTNEQTGKETDIFKVALTAKTCAELLSTEFCKSPKDEK